MKILYLSYLTEDHVFNKVEAAGLEPSVARHKFETTFLRELLKQETINETDVELVACVPYNNRLTDRPQDGLIEGRKITRQEGSYTTYLFNKGLDKILKKVGEESTEVIIAAKAQDKAETIYEISDLAYHVLVLMVEAGISLEDIRKELASRHVIDHKVKQEKMTK